MSSEKNTFDISTESRVSSVVVYYINLNEAKDRNTRVKHELEKIFSEHVIHRINAIKHTNGAYGCTCSHLLALDLAEKQDSDNVFIFEDDFQLELEPSQTIQNINNILKRNWSMILLSYHVKVVELTDFNDGLAKIKNGQTAVAYALKKEYIPELRRVLQISKTNLLNGDQNKYAADQVWKELQTQNGVYGMIPRLGRQRPGYSHITHKTQDYGGGLFMIILSCENYKSRRDNQDLKKCPFPYKYFIGGSTVEKVVNDNVYLTCSDYYEDLPKKTYAALEWVKKNYPNMDWIFKTDDDIIFDFVKLHKLWTIVSLHNIPYSGHVVPCCKHISTYHYGKVTDKSKEKPFEVNELIYCSGGGYLLSRQAMELCLSKKDVYDNHIFEDQATGVVLNSYGIIPVMLPLKESNVCIW